MPSATSPPDIQTLRNVWARLQLANQQASASHKESCDAQAFLWTAIDAWMKHCGTVERRYKECYHAYKSVAEERGSMANEVHALSVKHINLLGEVEKAEGLIEAANRRAGELDNKTTELELSYSDLAGQNVALQQNLDKAYEMIRILERGVAPVDLLSTDAPGSKNKVIHELDSVDKRSPEVRVAELQAKLVAMEEKHDDVVEGYKLALANALERISTAENKLKQFEDRETRPDNRETDSIVSVGSKRPSPSPGNGELQEAEGGKSNAERGGRKQPKRGKGRPRRLAPTNPDLRIVCS